MRRIDDGGRGGMRLRLAAAAAAGRNSDGSSGRQAVRQQLNSNMGAAEH